MSVGTGLLPPRYKGPRPVASGGMADVYRATDSTLGRAVAVKLLSERYAGDAGVRERFTREALAAARLSGNPNTITIYDVGGWNDRPFIVMEYLGGGSLEDTLRSEGAQPPGRVLRWLEQAGAALDAAHREGVVHRDVKPGNLLLDRRGNVHVADFGIASAAGLDSLTQTGMVLGTAGYLAPEQAKSEPTTAASDRYALAVVAFELLTGRRPFRGDTVAAEAAAHVTGDVPSITAFAPSLPPSLDAVFRRALAKDPRARHESCAELVAALRNAFDEDAGATRPIAAAASPARPARPARVVRRSRRPGWLLPLVALLLLAGAGGALAGALLTGGGDTAAPPAPPVSVRTVTQQGTTVQQTVTAAPPTTTTSTSSPPPGSSGDALNAQAYALMQQGNYQAALPLLQQAVQLLQGQTNDVNDGYANYNLGVTLIDLNRCGEAMPYLQAAKQIEPDRHEVDQAMKLAKKCA